MTPDCIDAVRLLLAIAPTVFASGRFAMIIRDRRAVERDRAGRRSAGPIKEAIRPDKSAPTGQHSSWPMESSALRRRATCAAPSGATMMQAFVGSLDIIDRCRNHVLAGSKTRRASIHRACTAGMSRRRGEAWRLLGERLDAIIA